MGRNISLGIAAVIAALMLMGSVSLSAFAQTPSATPAAPKATATATPTSAPTQTPATSATPARPTTTVAPTQTPAASKAAVPAPAKTGNAGLLGIRGTSVALVVVLGIFAATMIAGARTATRKR